MKVKYDSINGTYSIPLKLYEPDGTIVGYIIAVHGFCGDMESSAIKELAERMEQHGIAVVAFDFVGHGKSTADEHFCLSACRQDMLDVIEYAAERYNDKGFTAVFATSFGGYVTLLNKGSIPLTTKLVLRAPAVNMAKSFIQFVPDFDTFRSNGKCEMGFERKLEVPYSFYEELVSNPVLSVKCERPLLIIHGNKDDIVLPDDIEIFCNNNPMAVLKVIEGADHRFKNEGEMSKVMDLTVEYLIGS